VHERPEVVGRRGTRDDSGDNERDGAVDGVERFADSGWRRAADDVDRFGSV